MDQSTGRTGPQTLGLARWLLLGWVLFVLYGSWVPFQFRPQHWAEIGAVLRNAPWLNLDRESSTDWSANLLLFVPLTPLAWLSLPATGPAGGRWLRVVLIVAGGLLLSATSEFGQVFFPPRTPSYNDMLAQTLGGLVGLALTPLLRPWFDRLLAHWQRGGVNLASQLLGAYAIGYALLCLFPYDFIGSAAELARKLDSPLVGIWLAGEGRQGALRLLSLAVETLLVLPYGVLLARQMSGRWFGLRQAALLGLLLGLLIEGLQLLTVSGVSQGASVFSRMVGMTLGVQLWRSRQHWRRLDLAAQVRRHALPLLALYGAALLLANGWFSLGWVGAAEAADKLGQLRYLPLYYHFYTSESRALYSVGSVVLMYLPLTVLGWLLQWPLRRGLVVVGITCLVMELSKLFLAGAHPDPSNLMLALLSSGLAWRLLVRATENLPVIDVPSPSVPPVERARRGAWWRPNARGLLAALCAVAGLTLAWHYPLGPPLAMLSSGVVAVLGWRFWTRFPFLLAGLVTLFGFAPWTGWFSFEEMDLLVLATAAGAYARWSAERPDLPLAPSWQQTLRWSGLSRLLIGLFAASLLLAVARGLQQAGGLEFGWYQNYLGPMNSLRQAKGFVWALLLLPIYGAAAQREPAQLARWLGLALLLALAACGVATFWERVAYKGLLNFTADYRVTGQFWEMHVGGATLDGFLVLTQPFALAWLLRERRPVRFVALLLLNLLGAHAALITFSRGVYLALPFALGACLFLLGRGPRTAVAGRGLRRALLAALLLAYAAVAWRVFGGGDYRELASLLLTAALLMGASALPGPAARLLSLPVWALSLWWIAPPGFGADPALLTLAVLGSAFLLLPVLWPRAAQGLTSLSWRGRALWGGQLLAVTAVLAALGGGSYIAQRASTSEQDLQNRRVHWHQVLDLLSGPEDWLLGKGVGRFVPTNYLEGPQAERIGDFRLQQDAAGPVLQLRAGLHGQDWGSMQRVMQRIDRPQGPLRLQLRVRAVQAIELQMEVCERQLIYGSHCLIKTVMVAPKPGSWQDLDVDMGPSPPRGDTARAPRRVAFSMALRTRGALAEIASVQLSDVTGPLLQNGDFSKDLARWFFSSDLHHLPWHTKSLPLHILFEQGALGLGLVGLMLSAVLWRASVGAARGHPLAAPLVGGLLGLVVVGLFDSLIDAPRLGFVFYLLLLIGLGLRAPIKPAAAPPSLTPAFARCGGQP